MLRFTSWWSPVVLVASLVTCLSGSSTLEGYHRPRLHTFVISEDTNATTLTYSNTGADYEQIVATFQNSLPPPFLCGAEYDRCNALITSSSDESIRVVLLSLESGIGLVSFDYSSLNDSLVYRDQFLLSQNIPDCTFLFFVEELIGYCLQYEPAKIYALQIRVNYTNLNASMIHRRVDTSEVENLRSIANLSNFVYFIRRSRFDGCFTNERNHVIFLDQGELFDHSFMDERFLFPSIHVDSSCSKLLRVGDECGLATHCNGTVVLFDTREHIDQRSFPEAKYGQIFFCRSGDYVRFEREVLSLHDKDGQWFGNRVPFPLREIHGGHCINVDNNFFFVATTDSGNRTVFVNFSDASHRNLGERGPSTIVSAKVEGRTVFVNNGNETYLYNIDLPCLPEPLVLPGNFVFALSAFFSSSRVLDQYRCLTTTSLTISPIEPTIPIIVSPTSSTSSAGIVSGSSSLSFLPTTAELRMFETASTVSLSPTLLPMSTNIPRSSLLSQGGIVGIAIAVFIALTAILTLLVVALICFRLWWRKRKNYSVSCTQGDRSNGLDSHDVKLQNLNRDDFEEDAGGQSNPSCYQSPPAHKQEAPTEADNNTVMHVDLLERRESNDSQRTQVQAGELKVDGISSGSADTSAAASCGPHTQTLVLKNPVRQEVGDRTTDEQSRSELDTSEDEMMFQRPESHQDTSEEAPSIMNGVPAQSPADDAYVSPTAAMDLTTDTSQLCMENEHPLNLQASHLSNNLLSGLPATEQRPDLDAPVDHEDRSNGFLYGVSAAHLPLLTEDVKAKFQQTTNKMNSIQFRQQTVEVAGGTLWNEDTTTTNN